MKKPIVVNLTPEEHNILADGGRVQIQVVVGLSKKRNISGGRKQKFGLLDISVDMSKTCSNGCCHDKPAPRGREQAIARGEEMRD